MWLFAGNTAAVYNQDFGLVATLRTPPGGGWRSYPFSGTMAMLPLVARPDNTNPAASFIICGGSDGVNALATCITISPELGADATWSTDTMPIPRVMGDIVALPDQTFLIVNGCEKGQAGFGTASVPVLSAVLYNPSLPVNNRFSVLASTTIERMYHSEAILALDGRVIISGSTPNQDSNVAATLTIHPNERRIEAFVPAYANNAALRPVVTPLTNNIWAYNGQYAIRATIPGNIAQTTVVLIQPGVITHNTHMQNMFLVLNQVGNVNNGDGSFTITVNSPQNGNIAPPGYYQLWVVDSKIPCRMAQWVRVGAPTVQFPNL